MRLCNSNEDFSAWAPGASDPLAAWAIEIGPSEALRRVCASAQAMAGCTQLNTRSMACALVTEYCLAKGLTPAELDCLVGDLPERALHALSWLLVTDRAATTLALHPLEATL